MSKTQIGAQVPQKEREKIVDKAIKKDKHAFSLPNEFKDKPQAKHT